MKSSNSIVYEDCCVCCEVLDTSKFKVVSLECSHVFHLFCITAWSDQQPSNPKCPMCRAVICYSPKDEDDTEGGGRCIAAVMTGPRRGLQCKNRAAKNNGNMCRVHLKSIVTSPFKVVSRTHRTHAELELQVVVDVV